MKRITFSIVLAALSGVAFAQKAGSSDLIKAEREFYNVTSVPMPEGEVLEVSGLEMLPEIKSRFPRLPILILSQYPERQMAVRSIQAGASGYLTKDAAPEELVNAIKRLKDGKKYVTAEVAELLAERIGTTMRTPHEALSNREFRVFSMIASGLQVSTIAEQLNLSPKTVSTYKMRVLEKLALRSTGELIRYALEHGIPLEHETGASS